MEGTIKSGPAAEAWKRAAKARATNDFPAALAALDEAAAAEPKLQKRWNDWKGLLNFEQGFSSGEWLALPASALTWRRAHGDWRWQPTGELQSVPTGDVNSPSYFPRARLGKRFEVRGQLRFEPKGPGTTQTFSFLFGHDPLRSQNVQKEWAIYVQAQHGWPSHTEIGPRRALDMQAKKCGEAPWKEKENNTFRVLRDGTHVSAWINETQVVKDEIIPDFSGDDSSFGLQYWMPNGVDQAVYSKLEARNLDGKKDASAEAK